MLPIVFKAIRATKGLDIGGDGWYRIELVIVNHSIVEDFIRINNKVYNNCSMILRGRLGRNKYNLITKITNDC